MGGGYKHTFPLLRAHIHLFRHTFCRKCWCCSLVCAISSKLLIHTPVRKLPRNSHAHTQGVGHLAWVVSPAAEMQVTHSTQHGGCSVRPRRRECGTSNPVWLLSPCYHSKEALQFVVRDLNVSFRDDSFSQKFLDTTLVNVWSGWWLSYR